MPGLTLDAIQHYLGMLKGQPVRVLALSPLGEEQRDKAIKFCGYGTPIRIEYQLAGQQMQSLVLHTMRPGPFGHEHMADRAQVLLWSNRAFRCLSRHVASWDVGGFCSDGTLTSMGDVQEFFLLTEYADGRGYFEDLERLRDGGTLDIADRDRADALCDYLVEIHHKLSMTRGFTSGACGSSLDTENALWASRIAIRRTHPLPGEISKRSSIDVSTGAGG